MAHAFAKRALVSMLVLSVVACGQKEGPGGVHEGDYFSTKLADTVAEGFVSGWVGDRWVEVHKTGDLVQRIDLRQVPAFKVRCSHE